MKIDKLKIIFRYVAFLLPHQFSEKGVIDNKSKMLSANVSDIEQEELFNSIREKRRTVDMGEKSKALRIYLSSYSVIRFFS